MKSALIRIGSAPVQFLPLHSRTGNKVPERDSVIGILFPGKSTSALASPRGCLHVEVRKDRKKHVSIRRALSDSDMMKSTTSSLYTGVGSRPFPIIIHEEEEGQVGDVAAMMVARKCLERELAGGDNGVGKGTKGGGEGGGGSSDNGGGVNMGDYYKKMLKVDPGNALLLRNYGKYLHEVENNVAKAEVCYERAILVNPGDGEVLALYGKLIWETYQNEERAKTYFDRAIQASPDDCFVLGSYANFLWNSEEAEEKIEVVKKASNFDGASMVQVF